NLIFNLIVGRLLYHLFFHKLIFPLVRAVLGNLFRVGIANSRKGLQLVGRCGLISSGSFFAGAFFVSVGLAVLSLLSAACSQVGEDPIRVTARTAATIILISFILIPPCLVLISRYHSTKVKQCA